MSPKAGATTPPPPKPSTSTASIRTEADIQGTRRSPGVRGRPFEKEYLARLERPQYLGQLAPRALIHGEINPANARQADDGTIILVDWEEAGSAHPALEYGYPLIHAFISVEDHTFDEHSAAAFYQGYTNTGATIDAGLAFDAGLFHALRLMWMGTTTEQRWDNILFALKNEADIRTAAAHMTAAICERHSWVRLAVGVLSRRWNRHFPKQLGEWLAKHA
jgi:aminoglycoside phosphotransferase (APT) family kinase protein